MKIIKFNKDDEMNEIELSCKSIKTLKINLEEKCEKKGCNFLECVHTWNLEDIEIKCYGYTEGDDSLKNKHILPLDNDSKFNLYGCLFLVAFFNNKLRNIHISEYALLFYQQDMEELDDSNENYNELNNDDDNELNNDDDNELNNNDNELNNNDNELNNDDYISDYNYDQLELDTHTY